jgi:hypothetical protein
MTTETMAGDPLTVDGADGGGLRSVRWSTFRSLWAAQDADQGGELSGRRVRMLAWMLWVVALVAAFFTWHGARNWAYVALQVPYLVSGGLVVLVCTVAGAALYLAGYLGDVLTAALRPPADQDSTRPDVLTNKPAARRRRTGR